MENMKNVGLFKTSSSNKGKSSRQLLPRVNKLIYKLIAIYMVLNDIISLLIGLIIKRLFNQDILQLSNELFYLNFKCVLERSSQFLKKFFQTVILYSKVLDFQVFVNKDKRKCSKFLLENENLKKSKVSERTCFRSINNQFQNNLACKNCKIKVKNDRIEKSNPTNKQKCRYISIIGSNTRSLKPGLTFSTMSKIQIFLIIILQLIRTAYPTTEPDTGLFLFEKKKCKYSILYFEASKPK